MSSPDDKIEIENINTPGRTVRVNRAKFEAILKAMLAVLPDQPPGLTVAQTKEKLLPLLPQDLFPDGAKVGWWLKSVQLDQEAKGTVQRTNTKPLRLHLT